MFDNNLGVKLVWGYKNSFHNHWFYYACYQELFSIDHRSCCGWLEVYVCYVFRQFFLFMWEARLAPGSAEQVFFKWTAKVQIADHVYSFEQLSPSSFWQPKISIQNSWEEFIFYSTTYLTVSCSRQQSLTEWPKNRNRYITLKQEMELACTPLKNHLRHCTYKENIK